MFSKNLDWFNYLLEDAKKNIILERSKFNNIKLFIIEFIKKNNGFISDTDLLLNNKNTIPKELEIYMLDIHDLSKKLLKELCKKFGSGFLLKINLINKHYSIEYNVRILCNMHYIKQYHQISLQNFISPVIINDINVLPPIIELIDIYKKLYNPEYFKQWPDLLDQSKKLKPMVESQISEFMKLKCKACTKKIKCDKCKTTRNAEFNNIINLLKEYIKLNPNYVIIFDDINLSIISNNSIEIDFYRINNYLKKEIKNGIIYKKKNLFICKDLRIEKYTLYLNIAKYGNIWNMTNKPILDIYTNATYELIPHNKFIADPIIKLRFIYIAIWNILAAQKIHNLPIELSQENIKKYIKQINELEKKIDINCKKTFIGNYINEIYSLKKNIQEIKIRKSRIYCDQVK